MLTHKVGRPKMKDSATTTNDLTNLAGRTGLVVHPIDSHTIENLFAELEAYDAEERAETFSDLKEALNESRASVGAETAFKNE